jgi:hypothetical protein
MATQFVQGLQSGNVDFYKVRPSQCLADAQLMGIIMWHGPRLPRSDRDMQIGATCKHFAAYSLEQAGGTTRFRFNAEVSDM